MQLRGYVGRHSQENLVEPVYVLKAGQPMLTVELFERWLDSFRSEAECLFHDLMSSVRLPALMAPHVITSTRDYSKPWLDLGEYAETSGADIVVLNTHARRGLSRYFLGSFTECFLATSRVPLLLFNPACPAQSSKGPVIYPTRFTGRSKEGLAEVIKFAQSIASNIILYHRRSVPKLSNERLAIYYDTVSADLQDLRNVGEQWVSLIRSHGVDCDLILEEKKGAATAEAILESARKVAAQAIVLCPDSMQPERRGFSHLEREIIRLSALPVFAHYLPDPGDAP